MGTFQEQSASFEHMYAPSRAKALFSKHCALKDLHERDVRRMKWEWQTSDTELSKNIKFFERRSTVLQQKVKVIEDKLLSTMFENETDDVSDVTGAMTSARRSSFLIGRPQSSYVTAKPTVDVKKRPKSHVAGACSSSTTSSQNGDERPKEATVRFGPDVITSQSTENFNRRSSMTRARSASVDQQQQQRRASVASLKRTFSASGIRLTKQKKFELRNLGFYEENERYKELIQERIEDYYTKVEKYKEDFRKQKYVIKTKKQIEAEKEAERIRQEEESKKNAQKFQIKLRNPFGMTSQKAKEPEPVVNTDNAEETPVSLAQEVIPEAEQAELAPLTKQNLERLSNRKCDVKPETESQRSHELALRRHLSHLPSADAARERARLLYAEAHADIQPEVVAQRNIVATQPRQSSAKSQTKPQTQASELHVTFESFVDGEQSLDEMRRMIAEVARVKAKTKKARDRSFVPFISARKAAKAWRGLVDKRQKET